MIEYSTGIETEPRNEKASEDDRVYDSDTARNGHQRKRRLKQKSKHILTLPGIKIVKLF